jgi:hypothetical protein
VNYFLVPRSDCDRIGSYLVVKLVYIVEVTFEWEQDVLFFKNLAYILFMFCSAGGVNLLIFGRNSDLGPLAYF